PKAALRIPFTLRGHMPVVAAQAGDVRGMFGVDTGARSSLILNGPFIEKHRLREKLGAAFDGITGWGIGGAVRAQLVRIPSLQIGTADVTSVVARLSTQTAGALASDRMDGLIGGQLLARFNVTFDYSRSVMLLEKTAAFARADRWDGTGMWLGQRGDIFEVLDVIANGPAANAGLRVGDEVLAIDGRRAAALSLPAERLRLYADDTPRTIALTVRRGADEKQVTLKLRRLV
ncbi:MAG TPA: PDZ domain-containing protein, partial [Thermoanaerobaculia bacterium]|nr:PDZ domain-containing protein [Thermoanaerobaculia bacterium]